MKLPLLSRLCVGIHCRWLSQSTPCFKGGSRKSNKMPQFARALMGAKCQKDIDNLVNTLNQKVQKKTSSTNTTANSKVSSETVQNDDTNVDAAPKEIVKRRATKLPVDDIRCETTIFEADSPISASQEIAVLLSQTPQAICDQVDKVKVYLDSKSLPTHKPTWKSTFQLTGKHVLTKSVLAPRSSHVPSSKLAGRPTFIVDPAVADAVIATIEEVDGKLPPHMVEIEWGDMALTHAMLARSVEDVTMIANVIPGSTSFYSPKAKVLKAAMKPYNGNARWLRGVLMKIDLPEGCPAPSEILSKATFTPWEEEPDFGLIGFCERPPQRFLSNFLFHVSNRSGLFSHGRMPCYFLIPRPVAKSLFDVTNRLGVLTQIVAEVTELAVFGRELMQPLTKCSTGLASITWHLIKISPRKQPLLEYEIGGAAIYHPLDSSDRILKTLFSKVQTLEAGLALAGVNCPPDISKDIPARRLTLEQTVHVLQYCMNQQTAV
eukprot:m.281047 g.281047  ORF g.281047 m.281047 type:complete len:490 (-) comp15751_c6_seq2:6480-7949(-)